MHVSQVAPMSICRRSHTHGTQNMQRYVVISVLFELLNIQLPDGKVLIICLCFDSNELTGSSIFVYCLCSSKSENLIL